MKDINGIQKSINQIGIESVQRYLPKGARLHNCEVHGGYLSHYKDKNPLCPLCIQHDPKAEGTTASDTELYIDLRDKAQQIANVLAPIDQVPISTVNL